jgi:hypothetical protein
MSALALWCWVHCLHATVHRHQTSQAAALTARWRLQPTTKSSEDKVPSAFTGVLLCQSIIMLDQVSLTCYLGTCVQTVSVALCRCAWHTCSGMQRLRLQKRLRQSRMCLRSCAKVQSTRVRSFGLVLLRSAPWHMHLHVIAHDGQ